MFLYKASDLCKAMGHKYLRRWKGPSGKWEYAYAGEGEGRGPARREEPTGGHRGTLKGVTEKHVKELMKHYARRPKGMGKEKTIQTKEDLDIILTRTTFALMSAGRNPNNEEDMKLTDAQIKARHGELIAKLKDEGFIYTSCKGKYVNPEESVMVMMHDADRESAMAIGEAFHQDSIVFCSKGKNELIYTTGEKKGNADMAGTGYENVPDATDFYTKMPLSTGETVKFTMMLEDIAKALGISLHQLMKSRSALVILKAKKMPIGTVSHGRKKVAEGKWVDVPTGKSKGKKIEEAHGGIRPKDRQAIKKVAEGIAEKTFDSNEHTVQPYDNKELMATIDSYEKQYGGEAKGILLQAYARRYNKLNDRLHTEGDSFRQGRQASKPSDTKYVIWGYAPGQDFEDLLVSEKVDVNDSNKDKLKAKLESMGVTKIRFMKLEPLTDSNEVGDMFRGAVGSKPGSKR